MLLRRKGPVVSPGLGLAGQEGVTGGMWRLLWKEPQENAMREISVRETEQTGTVLLSGSAVHLQDEQIPAQSTREGR